MTMGSGGGGTAGGKYILSFQVGGPGALQLAQITNLLMGMTKGVSGGSQAVQSMVNMLNNLSASAMAATAKVVSLDAQIRLMKDGLESLKNVGTVMQGIGTSIIGSFYGVGKGVLEAVSPLENAANQMRVLGHMTREQAFEVIKGVKGLVAATPFKTNELVNMNAALVSGHVSLDAWKDSAGNVITLGDQVRAGFGRLSDATMKMHGNMKISASSILADFAALTGNVGDRMPTFVRGIQRAFTTGNTRLLMDQVPAEMLLALTGSGKMTQMKGTAEDGMKRIYDLLRKYNAVGYAALASDTATGIMSNFEEIPSLILQAIGGDPTSPDSVYGQIKSAFQGLFTDVSKVINNEAWQAGIAKGMEGLISMFRVAAVAVGKAVAVILEFFGDHPTVTKWGLSILAAGAALTLLAGTLLVVTASAGIFILTQYGMLTAWGLMKAALPALRAEMWLTFAPILIPLLKFIAIAALVAGAVWLIHRRVENFLNAHQPIKKFFEDVVMFFGAVGEALSNWDGDISQIGTGTAKKLEQSGLLNYFLYLMRGIWMVKKVATEMWETFSGPLLEAIDGVVTTLGSVLGVTLNETGDAGADMANTLNNVFRLFIVTIAKVGMYLSWLNFLFTIVKNVGQMVFTALYGGAYAVFMIFSDIHTVLTAIVKTMGNLMMGDLAGAASAISEGVQNYHGWEGQQANRRAVTGSWGEQAAGIGKAEGTFNRMYDLSERPIAGVMDRDPRAARSRMDVGGVTQPVAFDATTLSRLIQSGKVGADAVNEGIKSGQIVVNAVLNIDGEKVAQKMIKVQGRRISRGSTMQTDPRFDED